MIRSMAPVELPYLWLPVYRGKQYAYYRRNGRRVRLPALDDPGFLAAYEAAQRGADAPQPPPAKPVGKELPGSLGALVAAYMASPAWQELRPRTQQDYRENLEAIRARCGALPVRTLPRSFVVRLKDEFSSRPVKDPDGKVIGHKPTPRRATKLISIFRLLMSWGVDHGWRPDNPATKMKLKRTGPGYRAWMAQEVRTFLDCETIAEPLKRALVLGLYTGQRKGDCLTLTKAARAGGSIELVQSKTGKRVWIPEHPELTRWLDAAPATDAVTILTRADGRPWGVHHFGHEFTAAVRAAGLAGVSFHGLRKSHAAWLAEDGVSARQIMAVTGHVSMSQVAHYTEAADQRTGATVAIAKLRDHRKRK